MSDWNDEPPEVVAVLRERELEGDELRREQSRVLAAWGWAPARIVKRRVRLSNGKTADEWDYVPRGAAKGEAA